jgi:hypothetical protein
VSSLAASHLGERLAHLVQEQATGAGQPHVVRGAVEQPNPKLALEPADLLAERRLRDVLALGRPPEVQLLSQCHEVAQLTELHHRLQPLPRPVPRQRRGRPILPS